VFAQSGDVGPATVICALLKKQSDDLLFLVLFGDLALNLHFADGHSDL
jgi:hypothetical protein